MKIVTNDAFTISVSWPYLVSSITIVNVMPQFEASLRIVNYTPKVISYAPNIFIIKATGAYAIKLYCA